MNTKNEGSQGASLPLKANGGLGLPFYICASLLAAFVVFVLVNAESGAVSPSTKNIVNAASHNPPPPFLPGFDMVFWGQVIAVFLAVTIAVGFVWGWKRYPKHPLLLMMLASNSVCWLDPFNNWSIYLVYNPRLWHFPQDWPWVGLSPIIQPLMNFLYLPYVLTPYFIAIAILRRMQRKRPMDAFVWQRPLVSLAILTFIAGFIFDALQEVFMVSTQFYTYSHIVTFGSAFVGKYNQFPLLMASSLITIMMIPAAVLLYRDDTGKTQAEKLAQRLKLFRNHPATATFLTMAIILNISFMLFISAFYAVRVTGLATSVACPWPYPESVVYDPNGYYESEGQLGPFWEGRMNNWFAGLPDGRPENIKTITDRCDTRNLK